MPSQKARRADDKRLKANRPPGKHADAPKSRYRQLMDGELTVEDLDDEEILYGRCKDKNGKFTGRPPKTFPRAMHDALRREFQKRIAEDIQSTSALAMAALQDILADRRAAAPARVRAAEVILERNLGKVPDQILQQIELKPYEQDIEGLLVDVELPENVVPINHQGKEKSA